MKKNPLKLLNIDEVEVNLRRFLNIFKIEKLTLIRMQIK
jgi:hypothetical protein